MFGLSGLRCAQLRAAVRRSAAADGGDDSAAYWPVTLLPAVIAALTDTDHPLSSGHKTFIILPTFFPLQSSMSTRGKKSIYKTHDLHITLFQARKAISVQIARMTRYHDCNFLVPVGESTTMDHAKSVGFAITLSPHLSIFSSRIFPFNSQKLTLSSILLREENVQRICPGLPFKMRKTGSKEMVILTSC